MNDNFSNTPFAQLSLALSGAKKTPSKPTSNVKKSAITPAQPRVSSLGRDGADGQDDAANCALFLQAVGRLPLRYTKKKQAASFTLADKTSLPTVAKKNKTPEAIVSKTSQCCASKKTPQVPSSLASSIKTHDASSQSMHELLQGRDESVDFLRAMQDVAPLSGKGRDVAPLVTAVAPQQQQGNMLQDFMDGKLEFSLSLTEEYLEGYVLGLDDATMNRLRQGQYSPEAHLDLHGLNAMQAYQALVGFFRSAWYKGLRVVLLVPGRGKNSPNGIGVLREKVQAWLTQEPFKRVVLAFCTAKPVDGGPGSVYVLLRKYKKKGKICWERMPADSDLH